MLFLHFLEEPVKGAAESEILQREKLQRAWPGTLQEAAAVVVSALGKLQVSSLFLSPECSCESLIACAAAPRDLPSSSM